ncbi:universal stress protein [Bhargavaea ullalensis]|uniref:universal stress protein n=1 Tax=Bhargavaea ullalensis TaxID=1265685 RepID=UPI003F4971B8
MFQQVLVAYDGSDCSRKALEKAAGLIREGRKIHVHVMHVSDPPSMDLYSLFGPSLSQDVLQKMDEAARRTIGDAKKIMAGHEETCCFVQQEGNAGEALIDYANEHGIDLIILGSRGLGKRHASRQRQPIRRPICRLSGPDCKMKDWEGTVGRNFGVWDANSEDDRQIRSMERNIGAWRPISEYGIENRSKAVKFGAWNEISEHGARFRSMGSKIGARPSNSE